MKALDVGIVGIGAWAVGLEGWPALRDALADPDSVDRFNDNSPRAARPIPAMLPPAERRRTPDGVAVAIQVAREAIAAAGSAIDTTTLASVFASAYGDLAIVDYLCRTIASDPVSLSPTRFHLSVHNAAAGYWSIAHADTAPTSATAAGDDSFALGLVEAATLAVSEHRPVLLVAFDTPATGLIAATVRSTALFGFALVLQPGDAARDIARLALMVEPGAFERPLPAHRRLRAFAQTSAAARALALAEAIAIGPDEALRFPIGSGTALSVRVRATNEATAGGAIG